MKSSKDRVRPAKPLTPKQEKFCQKYVELLSSSEAYRKAYDAENMSAEAIHVEACRLLANPSVSLRVEHLQGLARKRSEVTVDRVVAEYSKLAFHDSRRAFGSNGDLLQITEFDDETAAAVAGFDIEERYVGIGDDRTVISRVKKIKLADKRAALDSLAKHLGMFTDKVELTGKDGGPLNIALLDDILRDPSGKKE